MNNPYEGFGDFLKDLPEKTVRIKAAKAMPIPDVTPLPCGCVPHKTHMSTFGTALYCETEQQPYCNFECPHEEFWEEYANSPITEEEVRKAEK